MSRTVHGRGQTLEEALTTAVSELLPVDEEQLAVRIEGVSSDGWTGRARVELEVVSQVMSEHDDEAVVAPAPAAEDAVSRDSDLEADEGDEASGSDDQVVEGISAEDLDEEADAAADFLEGLLDAMDLPGDLKIRLHADHAELEVIEIGSGALIGRRGQTLDAIQELVRCSLQRQFQRRARVKIDAEGYRARRMEKLLEKAEEAIDAVLDTGESERLEPMDVFERKAVHQLVAEVDGLTSRSQGREPARRVIIEQE
jgi:spoIIIJ-associated protein